jgi:two-component system, LytTR family, sensor histidine kinase AlgZ
MTEASRPRRFSRAYWARVLGANLAAAIVVTIVYGGVSWRTPPRRMLEAFAIAMLFSTIIGPLAGLLIPRVSRAVACRFSFPFDWIVLIATMVAIALTGSFTTILILFAIGYLHGAGIVATWMAGSLKASIVITLTFGIFLTVVESLRRQIDDARMALRTKERDEAEARRIAAEAQLASIESRVQPHFLFNTLNSIAALAHDDPAGAERMTGQLAALLRSALDSTATATVPLDDELKVVRAYLDIERVRFGDRLRYSVDVGEGVERLMVPRLALQTLVENSVKFAVSPQRDGGSIAVHAAAANGRLRVSVEDDGPGFDPAARPQGHGLDLLERRLRMLFGDRASLVVEVRAGKTSVIIDMPSGVSG